MNKISNEFYRDKPTPETAINELLAIIKQDPDMLKGLILAAMA